MSLQTVVERYLHDLRATLSTNVDEAPQMLALAVGKIPLRYDENHLVAEITSNLARILVLKPELCASVGAGRAIQSLAGASWIPTVEPGRRVIV